MFLINLLISTLSHKYLNKFNINVNLTFNHVQFRNNDDLIALSIILTLVDTITFTFVMTNVIILMDLNVILSSIFLTYLIVSLVVNICYTINLIAINEKKKAKINEKEKISSEKMFKKLKKYSHSQLQKYKNLFYQFDINFIEHVSPKYYEDDTILNKVNSSYKTKKLYELILDDFNLLDYLTNQFETNYFNEYDEIKYYKDDELMSKLTIKLIDKYFENQNKLKIE